MDKKEKYYSYVVDDFIKKTEIDHEKKVIKTPFTKPIFFNTNNGYTKFEDGTIIESIANRFVSFPAELRHTGTTCTDKNTRIVINFNYY